MADAKTLTVPKGATGVLVFADGSAVFGRGFGAVGEAVGELCFNTAMTGYQEVMTDPSYAGQIVTFTFPHIGNVGTNLDDVEADLLPFGFLQNQFADVEQRIGAARHLDLLHQ